jgi:hypothetical protein
VKADLDDSRAQPSTVGDTAYLYISKMNLSACKLSLDRDLLRIPVRLTVRP